MPMQLYDAVTPNSLRVHALLAEKGVDIPRVRIKPLEGETRTPEFLSINSRGELPVLELEDGRHLAESVAICRYLESLYPEPNLMGKSAEEQAFIEMWNRRMEFLIFNTVGNFARHTVEFFADKEIQVPAFAEAQMNTFKQNCLWLDKEMSDGRLTIADHRFTIADITGMAALMVCQFFDVELPQEADNVRRWADAMRARESFTSGFVRDEAA